MSVVYTINWEGKKKQVRPAPNVLLSTIVAEAAESFGIDTAGCILKYKNKPLDLSQSIRYCGIPSLSNLELEVKRDVNAANLPPTKLSINVNAGSSSLTGMFPASTSLYDVISKFVEDGSLPLDVFTKQVEIIYVRSCFNTIEQLKATTLGTLGLAG